MTRRAKHLDLNAGDVTRNQFWDLLKSATKGEERSASETSKYRTLFYDEVKTQTDAAYSTYLSEWHASNPDKALNAMKKKGPMPKV
jgi:hypothetical protein